MDIIRKGLPLWESITYPDRDAIVRDWIRNGYKINWESDPSPLSCAPSHPSAVDNVVFVDEQI
jgi:hypothetical protein